MVFYTAESYYVIFISIFLSFIFSKFYERCKNNDSYFDYICSSYNPVRNLLTEREICKKYKDTFLIKVFDMSLNTEEIMKNFASFVAEYIIILVDQKINILDPYIKIKFETKLYKILEIYSKCYIVNEAEDNIEKYKFLLIVKIINILNETHIDIFNVSKEIRKILNQNKYSIETFDNCCKYRNSYNLNIKNLKFNLEEVENLYNIIKTNTLI